MTYQECINCGSRYSLDEIVYVCKKCGNLLEVEYDFAEIREEMEKNDWKKRPLSVWRYKELMPIKGTSQIVSLSEGGTGLHRCKRLGELLGIRELYVKNEGENPTGSFKDRGMTVGLTKAVEYGVKTVICASTGNTSASLAAYAARSGLKCVVLIPSGKIAYGKLAQALIYGAKVIQVRGNFDQALEIVIKLSERDRGVYLLNSINPFRIEGQKSLGYEISEQLDNERVDRVVVPVGNAGNISAIWKGFTEFQKLGFIRALPKMTGIQAEGSAPIAHAVKSGSSQISPVARPETIATAIRIGAPVSWKKAMNAILDSHGTAETVTDEEILASQKLLARLEGLFVEPASASSIAGLKKLIEKSEVDRNERVVCVATGHGLKDPDVAVKMSEKPLEVDADVVAVKRAIGVEMPIEISVLGGRR